MKKVILLNKKEGETPLQTLERFRAKNKAYRGVKMTYAGRLDPMASGLLLILAGDECKKKEKHLALDKEYEFSVLFGFATDTYDILGKIQHTGKLEFLRVSELEQEIKKNFKFFRGKYSQKYPPYSSRTWERARAGEEVELKEREINVKSLKFGKVKKISSAKLLKDIEKRINKVKGDFRQNEILSKWRKYLKNKKENYFVASFKTKCGSGTYVRSIANGLGEKMGIPALAFSIKRTKLGKWTKEE